MFWFKRKTCDWLYSNQTRVDGSVGVQQQNRWMGRFRREDTGRQVELETIRAGPRIKPHKHGSEMNQVCSGLSSANIHTPTLFMLSSPPLLPVRAAIFLFIGSSIAKKKKCRPEKMWLNTLRGLAPNPVQARGCNQLVVSQIHTS